MATLISPLTAQNKHLTEYNALFTEGRLTPLSAVMPGLTGSNFKGFGYPYWLIDPSPAGFAKSKQYYLSTAKRNVPGYSPTIEPNNISEAWGNTGRVCIPWSSYTVPSSAAYLNRAFTEAFTNPDPNGEGGAFTFNVVPPVTGNPIPVLIWYPKDDGRYDTRSYVGGPNDCTPINHIFVTPRIMTAPLYVQTWLLSTGELRVDTYTPSTTSNTWAYRTATSSNPALTSYFWCESILGYLSLIDQTPAERIAPTVKSFNAGASGTDIYHWTIAKSHRNITPQLFTRQLSSTINTTIPQAVGPLSGLWAINSIPAAADVRTFYNFVTSTRFLWAQPETWASVAVKGTSTNYFANALRSSLIYGVPTRTFNGRLSSWTESDQVAAKVNKYVLKQLIDQYLPYWRTLTSIPASALNLFNYDPRFNTMVITHVGQWNNFLDNCDYTLYSPTLSTWSIYLSAPGLRAFYPSPSGILNDMFSRPMPSAINLAWPNTHRALNALVSSSRPYYVKIENTFTHFGKYELFSNIRTTQVAFVDLSSTGFVPLSSLTVLTTPSFVTDYINYNTLQQLLTGQTITLSGTLQFTASANIPVQALSATLPGIRNYRHLNGRFVWNGPLQARTVIVTPTSGVTVRTLLNQFSEDTRATVTAVSSVIRQSTPTRAFISGTIPINTLYTHPAYRNLRLVYNHVTTRELVNNIQVAPTVVTEPPFSRIANNIFSTRLSTNAGWIYVPRINFATGQYGEVLVNAHIGSLGYPRYDFNGVTIPLELHNSTNNEPFVSVVPFTAKPRIEITVTTPISGMPTQGPSKYREIKWRKQGILKRQRTVKTQFARRRRRAVLGI